jgi:hypothetical protein
MENELTVTDLENPTAEDAAHGRFGPAMLRLPVMERIFVCLLFHGAHSATDAARKAGFEAKSYGALRVQAHRMMHDPKVGEAMVEEAKRRKRMMLPQFDRLLSAIATNSQHKDQLSAIKLSYEQAGVTVARESNINVNVTVSEKEKLASIALWAKELGVDPAKLLGGQVIEGEFTEVAEDDASKPDEW